MNIAYMESSSQIEAKTCGCRDKGKKIEYSFIDSYHSLCIGKKNIILAQIDACERLLKYTSDQTNFMHSKYSLYDNNFSDRPRPHDDEAVETVYIRRI